MKKQGFNGKKRQTKEVSKGQTEQYKAEVFCEINANKVEIDKSGYAHTPESRSLLKKAKKAWKANSASCPEVISSLVNWMKQKHPNNTAHVVGMN